MKIEAVPSRPISCDEYRRDLEFLLDVFGSVVSHDEIASAYYQANCDVYKAGENLANLQGSTTSATVGFKEELERACSSSGSSKDALEQLLDAFHSVVSLEEIALAYHDAGGNVPVASKILSNLQGSTSSACTVEFKNELESESTCSGCFYKHTVEKLQTDGNCKSSKPKKCPVSMGTVSGVIGREYAGHLPMTTVSHELTKPLKLNSEDIPVSEIWDEKAMPAIREASETMQKDVEEFLFTMLGDGFHLDISVIREVLGLCGYDVKKSMEKLMDLSVSNLQKNDDCFSIAAEKAADECSDIGSVTCQETLQCVDATQRGKDRYDLQKEVLESLFRAPERFEEPKTVLPVRASRRSRAFGHVVVEPLRDTPMELSPAPTKPQISKDENEEHEDSYEVLRKAVKEYWITMKEYYKAAAEAFAKGNYALAYKLLDEGHFFMRKARETDEKSTQKLLETRNVSEEVCVDLHCHGPREARRLLEFHLTSLSGIPSIQNLKLIIGANDEDTKEGARKRQIVKLLEKESIKWTEEANGRSIVIRVDKINPKDLNFAKKLPTE